MAYVKEIFQSIAARVDNEPCCDWVGEEGAGHFVKMVHNGIEYGDMQLICFDTNPMLANLLLDDFFRDAIHEAQAGWRKVVTKAIELGVPTPSFSSALAYYDGYRSARLPANLLQAQRDYFGAHTYERLDKGRGEFFHTDWIG